MPLRRPRRAVLAGDHTQRQLRQHWVRGRLVAHNTVWRRQAGAPGRAAGELRGRRAVAGLQVRIFVVSPLLLAGRLVPGSGMAAVNELHGQQCFMMVACPDADIDRQSLGAPALLITVWSHVAQVCDQPGRDDGVLAAVQDPAHRQPGPEAGVPLAAVVRCMHQVLLCMLCFDKWHLG